MEFRYRAGERERGSSAFKAGNDFGRWITSPTCISRESLLEEIRIERMREEALAKKIAQKRMLEEEILRDMANLKQHPTYVAEAVDVRFEHGFLRWQSDSQVIGISDAEVGGSERSNARPIVLSSSEVPRKSLDMKFPARKLGGKKRNPRSDLPLPAKRRKTASNLPLPAKKERTCSLCGVNATGKKALNRHIKGKKHRSKEAQQMKMSAAAPSIESIAIADSSHEKESDESLYTEKHIISVQQTADKEKTISARKCKRREVWWCGVCKVKCYSEESLQYHLVGKKHKARSGSK